WWPEGRWLILGGLAGLAWMDADGVGAPHPLTRAVNVQAPWSISLTHRRLAYHEMDPPTGFDLWTVPVIVSADGLALGTPELFLRTPAFEVYPAFSPDGRWIAYSSNEAGTREIYVRRFPAGGRTQRVSSDGGRIPQWSAVRPELFYQ